MSIGQKILDTKSTVQFIILLGLSFVAGKYRVAFMV